jgi:ATP-dependent Clp protease ATP-binding subunit ClpA
MQVFDEGTLKTNRGNTIDFSRSIIIATTNAGHQVQKNPLGFNTAKSQEVKTDLKDLSASFDLALLNRFKERITFQPIEKETYKEILISKYHRLLADIRAKNSRITLPDDIPDDELDNMVERTYVPEFGARPANKAVEDYIYDQVL